MKKIIAFVLSLSMVLTLCTSTSFAAGIDKVEILKAVKKIAQDVKENKIEINEITEETISNSLYTVGQPDPDLLIRTSGELRTSNFLPWQIVYSEFVFVEKNWPDFEEKDLDEAIEIYQKRNRKFGAK